MMAMMDRVKKERENERLKQQHTVETTTDTKEHKS
jgi:hypothetical protein